MRQLAIIIENYPSLKANQDFLDLQQQLNKIKETSARSRQYYNGTVRKNNPYGESIPGILFDGLFNFKHFDAYEISNTKRQNVALNFDT